MNTGSPPGDQVAENLMAEKFPSVLLSGTLLVSPSHHIFEHPPRGRRWCGRGWWSLREEIFLVKGLISQPDYL